MKIDLHVHTDNSPCSDMSLKIAVKTALSKGIRAIAICDHDRPFRLTDFDATESGLSIIINPENRCENEFYIIPGVEVSTRFGHVLGLFIENTESIDKENPFDYIKRSGGITVLAHPFQHSKDYEVRVRELRSVSDEIDFVECASARANYKNKNANQYAEKFAESINAQKCAGSDAHFSEEIGNAYIEIESDFSGLNGLKECINKNHGNMFFINSKKTYIAKSQLIKNRKKGKVNLKSYLFYLYCLLSDFGDWICQK